MKRHSSDIEYENIAVVEKKGAYGLNKESIKPLKNNQLKIPLSISEDMNFLCDRTVSFMDSGFKCNIISVELAERSQYFERLLNYEKHKSTIALPEFLKSTFESVVEFIRTGKTEITSLNVYELFIAADYLLVGKLKEMCSKYLKKLANDIGVAVTLWINCRHLYWPELGNMAFKKILKNFASLRSLEFTKFDFKEIKQILSNESLNCKCEMEVFEAICYWINALPHQRINYLRCLLPCIRFGCLNESEISIIRDTPIVAREAACSTFVTDCLQKLNGCSNSFPSQYQHTPRISHDAILVIGGWCKIEGPRAAVQVFDPKANQWTLWSAQEPNSNPKVHDTHHVALVEPNGDNFTGSIGEIPKRVYAGCVIVNSKIFLVGGFDGDQALRSTLCYDTDADNAKWFEVSSMNERRHYVCVSACNNFIYAMGGHNGNHPSGRLGTAERYSVDDNFWKPISDMTRVRSDAASAEVGGRVYVCGGFDGRLYHDTVETYDDLADQWCLLKSRMVSPRGGLSLAQIGTTLYAIGGNDGASRLKSIERFDVVGDRWQLVGQMSKQKSNLSCAVVNDMIYILGGWSDEPNTGILDIVERFDTTTRQCQVIENLAFFASATCACSLTGKTRVNKYIRRSSLYRPQLTQCGNSRSNIRNQEEVMCHDMEQHTATNSNLNKNESNNSSRFNRTPMMSNISYTNNI